MSSGGVAYNPSDPVQQQFLSALALGETGGSASSATEGFGGVSLAGAPTDQYGFPVWGGSGDTHAAGTFQFQPGTWDSIASTYGLNFANPADQAAGAWYEAQQTYAQKTGGSLESDLQSGTAGNTGALTSIQNALASIWPSVLGSGAAPAGLASDIASGTGAALGDLNGAQAGAASAASSSTSGGTSIWASIENLFVRFGLFIIGGIIIIVALYFLLSNSGAAKTVRAAA